MFRVVGADVCARYSVQGVVGRPVRQAPRGVGKQRWYRGKSALCICALHGAEGVLFSADRQIDKERDKYEKRI